MWKRGGMWPKGPVSWVDDEKLLITIPFTWNLSKVKSDICQRSIFWDKVIVGGPAVKLIPGYFRDIDYVSEGGRLEGVLQRVNSLATRTTLGCSRKCSFCGVKSIETKYEELKDWPNLPVVCDNNLLSASEQHLEKVLGRLIDLGEADFNQGLDCRLMTQDVSNLIGEIKRPIVRISCDSEKVKGKWVRSFEMLRRSGIAKRNIRTYCLVGFDTDPSEAWSRCRFVEGHGVDAYPMWFHELDSMVLNKVTDKQKGLGWSDFERRRIMRWFYQHVDVTK